MNKEWRDMHPSHKRVEVDWKTKEYDFICRDCGLTDLGRADWGNLVLPCKKENKDG